MPNHDPTFTIILGEVSIILTILIIFLIGRIIARKRKQSKSLTTMLKRVASSEVERKQHLIDSFSSIPGLDTVALNNIIQNVSDKESDFYLSLSSAIINNDFAYFENIDNELHRLVAPYANLATSGDSPTINKNVSNDDTAPPVTLDVSDVHLSDSAEESLSNPEFDLDPGETDSADRANIQSYAMDIAVIPDDLLVDDNDSRS